MALNEDEQRIERQRAADRVSAFLDEHAKIGDNSDRSEIYRLNDNRLAADDLRLLVQAAPSLPPKWSDVPTAPLVHLVLLNGVCMLATRSEERAKREADRHAGAIMHTVGVQP